MTIETKPLRLGDPSLERLAEFLREQYPELADLKLNELSEFSEGWETDLYRLTLSGSRDGQPVQAEHVLRLYKGADPLGKARKESALMIGAAHEGVPTPRVEALVTDRSILGHPFVVMEYIAGGTLDARIRKNDFEQWLDPMAQLLVNIHALPWEDLIPDPQGPRPQPNKPLAFVESVLREMDLTIDRYGLADFGPTMDWLHEREAFGAATKPTLIHNDYHPQNILLRDDEMVVIDWSFSEVSDHRMDLAWSVMLTGVMVGREHRSAMLAAYESAAGSKVENFEYFEALKFTMRMLTIATWLDDSVQIPVAGITKQAIRGDYKIHALNPYLRLKEITGLEIETIEQL